MAHMNGHGKWLAVDYMHPFEFSAGETALGARVHGLQTPLERAVPFFWCASFGAQLHLRRKTTPLPDAPAARYCG